jgi:hypothetical protein
MKPLIEEDNGSDIWYTPMWFSDVWTIRRLIDRMDKISVGGGSLAI